MKQKLIIFGAGKIAQAASFYFNRDSNYEICAYCCDESYVHASEYLSRPLLAKGEALKTYPPEEHDMFVALGYHVINNLRKDKVQWAVQSGYTLASYRSPFVPGQYSMGYNTLVMDGAVIQPCVTLGNNVFVWGGTMIGHHAVIQDHCWLTGSCAVGGGALVGEGTFLGLNATLGHGVVVGKRCMVGANTLINKSVPDGSVLITKDTELHRLNSDQFSRMSTCFNLG